MLMHDTDRRAGREPMTIPHDASSSETEPVSSASLQAVTAEDGPRHPGWIRERIIVLRGHRWIHASNNGSPVPTMDHYGGA